MLNKAYAFRAHKIGGTKSIVMSQDFTLFLLTFQQVHWTH